MDFGLDLEGFDDTSGFMSQIAHEMKVGTRDRLKQAAGLVAEAMRADSHSRRVRAAITFDVDVDSPTEWQATIGPLRRRAFFAKFLEFGTRYARPFPFAEPALQQTEERVVDLVGVVPSLR